MRDPLTPLIENGREVNAQDVMSSGFGFCGAHRCSTGKTAVGVPTCNCGRGSLFAAGGCQLGNLMTRNRGRLRAGISPGRVVGIVLLLTGCSRSPLPENHDGAPSGGYKAVAAGYTMTCAIRADDRAICWGITGDPNGAEVTRISAGGHVTACGINKAGQIQCWGKSLGEPPSGQFRDVSVGMDHACALNMTGVARCWGNPESGGAALPAGEFTALSAAQGFTCGLRRSGSLECWGAQAPAVPSGTYRMVAAETEHTCAIRRDGSATCFDRVGKASDAPGGGYAEVGVGGPFFACGRTEAGIVRCWDASGKEAATGAPGDGPDARYSSMAVAGGHVCAIALDGSLKCWGNDWSGETIVPGAPFVEVSVGSAQVCGRRSDGAVVCWNERVDRLVAPGVPFRQIATGEGFACGLQADGTLACWGDGPAVTGVPSASNYVAVCSGNMAACGLTDEGQVTCWGDGALAQAEVQTGPFAEISCGPENICGLRSDGSLACWGENGSGESTPPAGQFAHVSAGPGYGCATSSAGDLTCWGDAPFATTVCPVGCQTVSTAPGFFCVLDSNREITCWGERTAGSFPVRTPQGKFTQLSTGPDLACGVRIDGAIICGAAPGMLIW